MYAITWLTDPEIYFHGRKLEEPPPKIAGYRHAEHADLPALECFIRPETYDLFGDIELGSIYEKSCLSVVQYNEKRDVISGVFLCNYPNVPSVPSSDWLGWLNMLSGQKVADATEGNVLFVHFLAWERRYADQFLEDLLTGLMELAPYLRHVILVLPPQVIPANVFEVRMTRIPAMGIQPEDSYSVQSFYVTTRHPQISGPKIRRVVEEDNDDVVPIVDAESSFLKEFYGEYYISEMVRNPDNRRQLIVSEDNGGIATGVMCLNETIDVDTLNENFELGAYHGLRKPNDNDEIPSGGILPASEVYFSFLARRTREFSPSGDVSWVESGSSFEEDYPEGGTLENVQENGLSPLADHPYPKRDSSSTSTSISDDFDAYHRSKIHKSIFADTVFDVPQTGDTLKSVAEISEIVTTEKFREVLPLPKYHGELNAFVLEIIAMRTKIKNRCSRNFLEAAFECFPNLDYCTILLPFTHPYFPLLEHFVRVPFRCNKDYPMTLYLTHRATILGDLKTRQADSSDQESLQALLNDVPKAEKILLDFNDATKESTNSNCYVFECNDKIVGVAILCAEKSSTFLKRRYHVEDYVSIRNVPWDGHGHVLHFALMPIFSVHLRALFRDVARLSGFSVLYYRLYEDSFSALTRPHPLATCLSGMIPVNARKRIEYRFVGYSEADEPMNDEDRRFSLFLTTPRLASLPFSIVDTKIVIVGASDCGVAFAEYLALQSAQNFTHLTNLILVSPHGLPFENNSESEVSRMIPFRGRYCREYRQRSALRVWITIVYGKVVAINRKGKYVSVMDQGSLSYDYLILTCGLQYGKPRFHTEFKARYAGESSTDDETPWNCLTINDGTEASRSLEKMWILTRNLMERKSIVFYGRNVDCYCALNGLLEFGAKGHWITLIEPPLHPCETHDSVFYNDCEVDVEVMNGILRNGVTVLVGWNLIDWLTKDTRDGKIIESIVIESYGKARTIACDVFFNFHEKTIDPKIFLAICRAGLVFDGQVVIDPQYRTNDPFIFAAGTVTKYSRKYYAQSWQHKYYNRIEIGERLAKILQTVVEFSERNEKRSESTKNMRYLTLPIFRTPFVLACTLPGGYCYLHVRKPGKTIPRKVAIRHNFYGNVMATGSCSSDIGYFRIRLNLNDTVETITCLNKKNFEVEHLIELYGKHESLLNELKTRFRRSLISDFFAYFREPWASAIFYDRFECLRIENRATLLSKTGVSDDSLIDDCTRALIKSNWESISEEDRRYITSKYPGSVYHRELEENFLDFLQFSEDDLAMYLTPARLRQMYADIDTSPLYTEL